MAPASVFAIRRARLVELPTGHYPMVTVPGLPVELFLALA